MFVAWGALAMNNLHLGPLGRFRYDKINIFAPLGRFSHQKIAFWAPWDVRPSKNSIFARLRHFSHKKIALTSRSLEVGTWTLEGHIWTPGGWNLDP